MKQATQIVITGYEGIRLTIALESVTIQQENDLTNKAIQFYKSIFQDLIQKNALEQGFDDETNFRIDLEDEIDNDSNLTGEDDYEEYYEFEYHRYK